MILWNLRSQRMSRQHNKQAHCMLSTEVQRSVRLNKKKKSTNISPYPDEAIERLARAFYPAILACWNSEEGQREFAAWQAEQAHISGKEKQEVPASRVPIKQYLQKFPQWGKIWRDFGHAFSFASSSSRGIYPSPSYLIWMCCTRFPLDLSGAST